MTDEGNGLQLRFNLAPGTEVRADFRGVVTPEAIRTFIDYLRITERTLARPGATLPSLDDLGVLFTPAPQWAAPPAPPVVPDEDEVGEHDSGFGC